MNRLRFHSNPKLMMQGVVIFLAVLMQTFSENISSADICYYGNWSFCLQVVSPTSRFAHIDVVSPTWQKSFHLHGPFAYIEVNSPTPSTYY